MSTVGSMLYRVILWIGVCTGAVFCCGNLANRPFAKKTKMTKCMLVNNTFVHTAISMCVRLVQFVSLSLRKKRKRDIGGQKQVL